MTRALFIAAAVAASAISGAAPAGADTAHYLHCIKHNTFAGVSFPFDDNTLVKIGIEAYHATGGPPQRPETVNPEISVLEQTYNLNEGQANAIAQCVTFSSNNAPDGV
jgi:hypothetical protein